MEIKEIIWDAVRYPLSDWKKILILGIILLISTFSINQLLGTIYALLDTENVAVVIVLLTVIGLSSLFLGRGYQFRIIKSSLNGSSKLPKFNAWIDMFKNGIKMSIITIVYLIPLILILMSFKTPFVSTLHVILSNISSLIATIFLGGVAAIFLGRGTNLVVLIGTAQGIESLIIILYMIIIFPISLMSLSNMANNNSKLSAAFKFHQIIHKITSIGWKNLIIWYMVTEILFLIILSISSIILKDIFRLINPIIGIALESLIVISYLLMYLYRSVALFYMSE